MYIMHNCMSAVLKYFFYFFAEPEEPDHDYESVGGAVLVRLQAEMGAKGIWWSPHASRPIGPHLETRYRPV